MYDVRTCPCLCRLVTSYEMLSLSVKAAILMLLKPNAEHGANLGRVRCTLYCGDPEVVGGFKRRSSPHSGERCDRFRGVLDGGSGPTNFGIVEKQNPCSNGFLGRHFSVPSLPWYNHAIPTVHAITLPASAPQPVLVTICCFHFHLVHDRRWFHWTPVSDDRQVRCPKSGSRWLLLS